ncbi:MAG: hypothetical protein AABZ47_15160 [Planctomycetota bacterium]
MQEWILKHFPDLPISVSFVWIDFLDNDRFEMAKRAAGRIQDPRVKHFHDARDKILAGNAFANGLIRKHNGPAWDVYLFYAKGVTWDDTPPMPTIWWHQLSGNRRAHPKYFAKGKLPEKLHDTMHTLTGIPCNDTKKSE